MGRYSVSHAGELSGFPHLTRHRAGRGAQLSSPEGAFPTRGRVFSRSLSLIRSWLAVPLHSQRVLVTPPQAGLRSGGHTARVPAGPGGTSECPCVGSCRQSLHAPSGAWGQQPSCGLAQPFTTRRNWVSYEAPLCLSFLLCETEVTAAPFSWVLRMNGVVAKCPEQSLSRAGCSVQR